MNPNDPMVEVYIYENMQLIEKLEEIMLEAERSASLSPDQIDEVFRVMHTIKGSSAMMSFDGLAALSHAVEDMFSNIRERQPRTSDWVKIIDIILRSVDILKVEIGKITNGQDPDGDVSALVNEIENYLGQLKKRAIAPSDEAEELSTEDDAYALGVRELPGSFYRALVYFQPECMMESVRAFSIVNAISEFCSMVSHIPENISVASADKIIAANGFTLFVKTNLDASELRRRIDQTMFVTRIILDELPPDSPELPSLFTRSKAQPAGAAASAATDAVLKTSMISVNISKLDKLMNLVGEIVTTEAMVIKNPDLDGLDLDNFEKSARQLRKLTDELQDIVMSIRMVPVSNTFRKMNRIVRDVSKKVDKNVHIELLGEETEVDKNIIDTLSDPLMHIIRNSVDHGIEPSDQRILAGKPAVGKIVLEARNIGGDVIIVIQDDGKGLDKDKIYSKAVARGVTNKPIAELSDKEIYNFILLPGFSTNDQVTEFSGRGVGMDVVKKNIDKIGGLVGIESVPGKGMTTTIKIPLTLAIVEGMKVSVGDSIFIIPVLTIRESFKPKHENVVMDPDGNEMIMIRGECYPIMRLHNIFNLKSEFTDFEDGIMVMVESDTSAMCLFVDKLIGEQQAVVKPMPTYISRYIGSIRGLGGCTILGDGSISLILDINSLIDN